MTGGTEIFFDLGLHCHQRGCHQLDFLPFNCVGCRKNFCLDHRSFIDHECPKSDIGSRKVVVCKICLMAIETTGFDRQHEDKVLETHQNSMDCDPRKKKKPTCPVNRCKEVLTFSNTSTCKSCHIKVCLKHRFSEFHSCKPSLPSSSVKVDRTGNHKISAFLSSRNEKDCSKKVLNSKSPSTDRSVKAF